MGFLDIFRRTNKQNAPPTAVPISKGATIVGAKGDDVTVTFNDRNITYTGDLATFDYDAILRNKQQNIYQLFELSDYFVDADPIYRGIIKEVYALSILCSKYTVIYSKSRR